MVNYLSLAAACNTVSLFQNNQYVSCFIISLTCSLGRISHSAVFLCRSDPGISPAQTLHWASCFTLTMLDLDAWPHIPQSILLLTLLLGLTGECPRSWSISLPLATAANESQGLQVTTKLPQERSSQYSLVSIGKVISAALWVQTWTKFLPVESHLSL